LRLVAFISGDRIHVSKAASTATNESVVQFLGYLSKGQQECPDIEIATTKLGVDAMEFKVVLKTSDGKRNIQGIHLNRKILSKIT